MGFGGPLPAHGDVAAEELPSYNALEEGDSAAPEVLMPHYEYLCLACNKRFSQVLTLAEYEKGSVKCPKCGSSKVEQQWAAFTAVTSKKS
jgi:putative FmdB family regulatory protein